MIVSLFIGDICVLSFLILFHEQLGPTPLSIVPSSLSSMSHSAFSQTLLLHLSPLFPLFVSTLYAQSTKTTIYLTTLVSFSTTKPPSLVPSLILKPRNKDKNRTLTRGITISNLNSKFSSEFLNIFLSWSFLSYFFQPNHVIFLIYTHFPTFMALSKCKCWSICFS